MVTGALRSSVDKLWKPSGPEAFPTRPPSSSRSITRSSSKRLDENQTLKEIQCAKLGGPIEDPIYSKEYDALRCKKIKDQDPDTRFALLTRPDAKQDNLTVNRVIDERMLAEAPFTEVNDQGVFGVFEEGDLDRIISIVERVNGNAAVG